MPKTSFVLQIGANDHEAVGASGRQDIVPYVISLGWHALLLEPVPYLHARLTAKYAGNPRVRTQQAAICPPGTPNVFKCNRNRTAVLYYVETTNITGNWGSDEADPRCILDNPDHHYLLEVASFSVQQLLRTQGQWHTPYACKMCSQRLQRKLPSSCLRHVVWKNVKDLHVPCACLKRVVRMNQHIDLLFIDAEGYDDIILREFPFAQQQPTRVVFEPKHLGPTRFADIAHYLRGYGYECADMIRDSRMCRQSVGTSVWQRTTGRYSFFSYKQ
tara:strand:+ start:9242 stop:10060 length:819 start_codon:yes stop_codon:yes gene_type:complete